MDFIGAADARQVWDGLALGRKREVLREVFTVTPRPLGLGRGAAYPRTRIDFGPSAPGYAAAA